MQSQRDHQTINAILQAIRSIVTTMHEGEQLVTTCKLQNELIVDRRHHKQAMAGLHKLHVKSIIYWDHLLQETLLQLSLAATGTSTTGNTATAISTLAYMQIFTWSLPCTLRYLTGVHGEVCLACLSLSWLDRCTC